MSVGPPLRQRQTRAPLVVEVARYRREDGPGIRSVVFFKGCELRCGFCQNPEAQEFSVEIAAAPTRCIQCRSCSAACRVSAVDPSLPGLIQRDSCTRCGACADACPTGGLRRIGTSYAAAELAEVLLRDRRFYQQSGGGVTLSGGEPALFLEYLGELLPLLKRHEIHILLETSGHFPDYQRFQSEVLPHIDVVDFGIKLADPEAHREMAGQDNRLILANLRRLAKEPRVTLQASIPLVPGLTDTEENLRALLAILNEVGIGSVRLLPYNPIGVHMAEARSGLRSTLAESFTSSEDVRRVATLFQRLVDDFDFLPTIRAG